MTRDTAARTGPSPADVEATEPKPLTERILSVLPGPRLPWLAVWVLVPWINAATTLILQSANLLPRWEDTTAQLLNRVAFSFSIAMALWGTARITRGTRSLRSGFSELAGGVYGSMQPLRGMGSVAVPLLLTIAAALVFGGESVAEHGSWVRAFLTGGSWLLIGIASWTFVWVYLNLQVGLHRFGRRHLSLDAYPNDYALGLRPLGALAFTGFWTLVVTLAPLLVATGRNRLGLGIGLVVLLAGVAAFFLSVRGLNRQMVAAKQRELAWARQLYAQAFRPVREEPTLGALQRQAGLLSAAEALEKRAERIQEWPFDERTVARVVAIGTSVLAAILVQVLLAPFGT